MSLGQCRKCQGGLGVMTGYATGPNGEVGRPPKQVWQVRCVVCGLPHADHPHQRALDEAAAEREREAAAPRAVVPMPASYHLPDAVAILQQRQDEQDRRVAALQAQVAELTAMLGGRRGEERPRPQQAPKTKAG